MREFLDPLIPSHRQLRGQDRGRMVLSGRRNCLTDTPRTPDGDHQDCAESSLYTNPMARPPGRPVADSVSLVTPYAYDQGTTLAQTPDYFRNAQDILAVRFRQDGVQ